MHTEERKLAEAAAALSVEDFEWLKENRMIAESAPDPEKPVHSHVTISQQEAASQETAPGKKTRKRRYIKRQWPETGTILQGDYEGVRYEVEVIPSPRYKAGRALKILTGPAAGKTSHSMSGAMFVATESQRKEKSLGRKGLVNGWTFWRAKGGHANETKS